MRGLPSAVLSLVFACGASNVPVGATPRPAKHRANEATPAPPLAQAVPDAGPLPPAPVVEKSSSWFVQILDYEPSSGTTPQIFARPTGITILENTGVASTWLRHTANGWVREQAHQGDNAVAAFDTGGGVWVLGDASTSHGLELRHGKTVETVLDWFEPLMQHASVAVDATDTPHVCVSTYSKPVGNASPGVETLSHVVKVHGKWTSEVVPGHDSECAMVFGDDGSIYIGTDDGVAVKTNGRWRLESLGGPTRVARAADGAIVAVTEAARSLGIARLHAGSWSHGPLLPEASGDPVRFAFAVDSHGLVHAVVDVRPPSKPPEIYYVREGTPVPTRIAIADAQQGIGIALDQLETPHVVYAHSFRENSASRKTIEYARPRVDGDAAQPARDDDGIIAACAALVAEELGAEPLSDFATRQAQRLCLALHQQNLPLSDLANRCESGGLDACLLGGALVRERSHVALRRMELAHQICEHKGDTRCWTAITETAEMGTFLPTLDADAGRAKRFFDRACELGSQQACLYQTWSPDAAVASLAKLCLAGVPLACASALTKLNAKDERQLLRDIRAALEAPCKLSALPTACVTLAYLQEAGLGGPVQPANALRNHLRACALYSPTACMRLLIGPLGRPAAPKQIDPEKLEALLAEQCSRHDDDACLAYAAAHERGWGVLKDTDGANTILEQACEEQHLAKVCKKLGRKEP